MDEIGSTYMDRPKLSVQARGFGKHLKVDHTTMAPSDCDFDLWRIEEIVIVQQQIASTTPRSLFFQIKENRSITNSRPVLSYTRTYRGNCIHFVATATRTFELIWLQLRLAKDQLESLGDTVSNTVFAAILFGTLPKFYDAQS